jgi:hypothetical protein
MSKPTRSHIRDIMPRNTRIIQDIMLREGERWLQDTRTEAHEEREVALDKTVAGGITVKTVTKPSAQDVASELNSNPNSQYEDVRVLTPAFDRRGRVRPGYSALVGKPRQ